jgi:hypothetical protein
LSPNGSASKWGQPQKGRSPAVASDFLFTKFRQPLKFSSLFFPDLRPATYDLLLLWEQVPKRKLLSALRQNLPALVEDLPAQRQDLPAYRKLLPA